MTRLHTLLLCNCIVLPQTVPSFDGLPALASLDLSHNHFFGSIPLSLFTSHSNLATLSLRKNNLTGTIPPSIVTADLSNLFSVTLSDNKLRGHIPNFLQLSGLMFLSLYDNLFTHAPHMLLTSEAIKTELYGNPLCSPYRLEVSQVCLPPEPFPDFTFPSFCANLDCNPRYRPNFPLYHRDHTCECVSAMEVQLRLPASQYSVFSEDLVNTFRGRIRFSLRRLGVNMTKGGSEGGREGRREEGRVGGRKGGSEGGREGWREEGRVGGCVDGSPHAPITGAVPIHSDATMTIVFSLSPVSSAHPFPPPSPSPSPHQIIISTITTAVLTDSDITMSILFFPPLDDITWQRQPAISQPEMIRNAFDSHRVILGSDLGPYRILGYYNPDGEYWAAAAAAAAADVVFWHVP
ncbi:unnamed protein product [Closterium sp. NIES-54]